MFGIPAPGRPAVLDSLCSLELRPWLCIEKEPTTLSVDVIIRSLNNSNWIPKWKSDSTQQPFSRVESYITTDSQSASLSWNKAPIWGLLPDFLLLSDSCGFVDVGRFLSDERTGLSFTIAAGLRQRSHSRVRVPWDSRPILLSQIPDFLFCRLLRLAGLRWRYSIPPQHGLPPFS
jgi:hypothetical protein